MPISEIVLITMGLLTIAMLAAGISRNLPIPFTVFLVILGIVIGGVARSWPQFEPLLEFQLTPELVLFLFLPALIFESAFNLDARQLVKDLLPVLALAVPALLVSTAIIGTGLWLMLDIEPLLALLFGALISATDPVAVIALFKELGAPLRLTILVEGESLLNDATAIVVFNIILGILVSGSFGWSNVGEATLEFLRVFLGGAVAGVLIGVILSELLYRLKMGLSAYLVMSIILAYASFSIAEHLLHVSGVMAVVSGAITLGILAVNRIPQSSTHVVKETWEMIALVFNSLLFLLVGVSIDPGLLIGRIDTVLLAVLLVLIARAATVYSMVPATIRLFGLPHVSMGERHIMWWGGLKGGLAIAIVLSIPEDIPGKPLLLDLTLGVVMFSLLINAPTVRPLIRFLGIDRLSPDEVAEYRHGLRQAEASATDFLDNFQKAGLITRGIRKLVEKNNRQIFAEDPDAQDTHREIRHLFISALRIELETLKYLYDIGLIQYYIYLDIKNNIQRDRENWISDTNRSRVVHKQGTIGIFARIENSVVRKLREKDWAASLLSRYQYLRFSQRLQRDLAGIYISNEVLSALDAEQELDDDSKKDIRQVYQDRLERRKQRIDTVAREFPDFYSRFLTRLLSRVSLNVAGSSVEHAFQHGEVGAKAYSGIERLIEERLGKIPRITGRPVRLRPEELIEIVPLLKGLRREILVRLAGNAQEVTFLAGDIVIGEGERGDALYIISHGCVVVYHESQPDTVLAELKDGDFFGEMALLGDQVRNATVKASTTATLLRLRRRDVLKLAEMEPELKARLLDADEVRRTSTGH